MNKSFTMSYFVGLLLSLFSILVFNWYVDPLQYYRRNLTYPLDENDRWQVAAFIRSFKFDTAIVGTSLTQNFSLRKLKESGLAQYPIRLSISGANLKEQLIVLESALKTDKVKNIIWGLDKYKFYESDININKFPAILYRPGVIKHLYYLFNSSTIIQSLRVIRYKQKDSFKELDGYNSWGGDDLINYSKAVKIMYQDRIKKNNFFKYTIDDLAQNKKYVEKIITLIQFHPNVTFYIFFPPYSIAYHKLEDNSDQNEYMMRVNFRNELMSKLTSHKNVVLYDFETATDIITDFNQYKDLIHYRKKVSSYIISALNSNKYWIRNSDDIARSQKKYISLKSIDIKY